jgi:hypothetical protein
MFKSFRPNTKMVNSITLAKFQMVYTSSKELIPTKSKSLFPVLIFTILEKDDYAIIKIKQHSCIYIHGVKKGI